MSVVRLPVTQPFPWRTLLDYLEPRCIPGAETVKGDAYHRFDAVRVTCEDGALILKLARGASTQHVKRRVEHLFRPALKTQAIDACLAQDETLSKAVALAPGMRLPGCWSGFELAVRVIIGQQVTIAAARTLLARVVERCSGGLAPQQLMAANLSKLGMPQARVDTLLRVAALAESTDFDGTNWPQLRPQLAALKGVGPWTLGYLDMRLGLQNDIFPATDVGLQLACSERNAKRLAAYAERWAPWRSFAALRLWQA